MKTFHLLVANTLLANVTNNFLWFALTFWVYLETKSVMATAIIGGGYMLLLAVSGMFFGTFVDRHLRKTSMLLSNVLTLIAFVVAGAVYALAPAGSLQDLGHLAFWALVTLILGGRHRRQPALGGAGDHRDPPGARGRARQGERARRHGQRRGVRDHLGVQRPGHRTARHGRGPGDHDRADRRGAGPSHDITVAEEAPEPSHDDPKFIDIAGALRAVRIVPGLMALLLFSTFNNFLGGVFMALMDPYGLSLMSVEAWGVMLGITSMGFIVGGILVARRGLGANPVRTLLLANIVLWSITLIFPIRSEILPLALGFFLYMALAPVAEASEQTIVQKVVPFKEQGRVFGFAQSLETAASPVTAFLIGPIAQFLVIPAMTDGAGADAIGSWFGTGPERGMALIFIVAGSIGLARHDPRPPVEGLPEPVRPIRGRAVQLTTANSGACRRPEAAQT